MSHLSLNFRVPTINDPSGHALFSFILRYTKSEKIVVGSDSDCFGDLNSVSYAILSTCNTLERISWEIEEMWVGD